MKHFLWVLIPFFLTVLSNMIRFDYGVNDAFWRTVWWIDEETVWSENFSENVFNRVKIGMTDEQVLTLLGNPLDDVSECSGDCFWKYTRQRQSNADFDQRWIVFDQNRFVKEIRKSFFVD